MQSFKVTMSRPVILAFFLLVVLAAAGTAWAFGAGLTWTGICMVVVGAPMSLLYWYMLWANPARTRIMVLDEGLHLKVPPFFTASVPWESVVRVFESEFDETVLEMGKAKRSMRFGGYVSGIFERAGKPDNEVMVAARPGPVVCVETDVRLYVLGPNKRQALLDALLSKTTP